jgi:hypothetical protein
MTAPLQVDTDQLRSVGSTFASAGDGLAGLRADAPLGDAAVAVPQLQTAGACREAQSTVAAEMTTIADAARAYGADLKSAAEQYDSTDQTSGGRIGDVDVPSPAGS